MSRSRRRHSWMGITTAASEKQDKQRDHRRFRHAIRQGLQAHAPDETWSAPAWRAYSDVWSWAKDGKMYLPPCEMPPRLWRK